MPNHQAPPVLSCSPLFCILSGMALALVLYPPILPAQEPEPAASVVDAARQARERQERPGKHPRVITNEDLEKLNRNSRQELKILAPRRKGPEFGLPPGGFGRPKLMNASQVSELPLSAEASRGCDSPRARELRAEVAGVQAQLDTLRAINDSYGAVVSNDDWDPQYFRPGGSGLFLGSPPRSDSQPQSASRVGQAELEERLARMQRGLQIVCEPPRVAEIQRKLDQTQGELDLARRQFALDQEAYYQQPASPSGAPANAWLDSERQHVLDLQGRVDQLRAELAAAQAASATLAASSSQESSASPR